MSAMKPQTIFLPTDLDEVLRKILRLQRISGFVRIWTKKSTPQEMHIYDEVILDLKNNALSIANYQLKLPPKSEYFINFEVSGVAYFGKGKLENELLFSEFYKVDKRKKERLLLYPHYTGHLILKIKKNKESNIISIRNPEVLNTKIFTDFNSNYLECRIPEKVNLKDYVYLESRLIDLSTDGLGCLTNEREKNFLKNTDDSNILQGWLIINKTKFAISNISLLHVVEYFSSKIEGVPLFKVGLSFHKKSMELVAYINKYLENGYDENQIKNEFQDIFKK